MKETGENARYTHTHTYRDIAIHTYRHTGYTQYKNISVII